MAKKRSSALSAIGTKLADWVGLWTVRLVMIALLCFGAFLEARADTLLAHIMAWSTIIVALVNFPI